jgi:hypothetical protein
MSADFKQSIKKEHKSFNKRICSDLMSNNGEAPNKFGPTPPTTWLGERVHFPKLHVIFFTREEKKATN